MPTTTITPEGERTVAVVLYDPRNGTIVHVYSSSVDAGAEPQDRPALEKEALASLARSVDKGQPRKGKLSFLQVDPRAFTVRASYKVDLKKRALVETKRKR